MGSIKRGGVALAGGAAATIVAAGSLVLARVVVLDELLAGVSGAGEPAWFLALLGRAVTGALAAWVYVAFRPRFGGGRRAILGAVVAVWGSSAAIVTAAAALIPALPALPVTLIIVWSLIDLTIATYAAAFVYRSYLARATRRRGRRLDGETIL